MSEGPREETLRLGRVATAAIALGLAALVLFSMLAKSGIWDPYELDTADLARRIAINTFGAADLALPKAANGMPTLSDLKMGELPFTSMALAFKVFGVRDWVGRLPLAIWAFAGVLALYVFLARLVHRRAALYATVALVTMPLFFMQARTMLGDAVTMSARSRSRSPASPARSSTTRASRSRMLAARPPADALRSGRASRG